MGIFNFLTQKDSQNKTQIKQLGVNDISKLYKDKNYILIDVREEDEWRQGIIPGAKKISLGNISSHFDKLDKNANYVMICRSGARSGIASDKMAKNGFTNISNFRGGMLDWYSNNLPLSK